jgi:hypothetical protein
MSTADPVALVLATKMLAISPLSPSLYYSYLPPPYRLRGCLYSLCCRPYLSPRRLPYKCYTSLLPLCILPSPCSRLNTHLIPAFGTLLLYRLLLRITKPIAAPTPSAYLSILLALYPAQL